MHLEFLLICVFSYALLLLTNGSVFKYFPTLKFILVIFISVFSFICQETGNGLIAIINPVTGAILKDTPPGGLDLGFKVIQAQLLDVYDEEFLKGILLVDSEVKVNYC